MKWIEKMVLPHPGSPVTATKKPSGIPPSIRSSIPLTPVLSLLTSDGNPV
jgi:hypothetical protein